ncbi:hypothetical protein ACHMW5_13425 [Azospirillum melinis]|uniref:hypothetical protein n=1 Tax=Azospirillum melinis TaxID=328839 RepID=UPI0037566E4A
MLIEVDHDHFRGALALPLFGGPQRTGEYDFRGDDTLPAGRRVDLREPHKIWGRLHACMITQADGTRRYWIADHMPRRTYAQAMQHMDNAITASGRKEMKRIADAERDGAEKMGVSVAEYRAIKKADRAFKQAERDRFYGFHATEVNPYNY